MQDSQRTSYIAHFTWISLLVFSVVYLFTSLRVVSDITQFMPDTHKDKDVQLLLSELQQGNTARLLILRLSSDSDNDDAKELANLSRQLKARLDKDSKFGLIHNGQQTINSKEFITGQYKTLYQYRYLLSHNKSFSEDALSSSLNKRLSELRSGLNIFKNSLSSDPQNQFADYLWKLTERGNNTHHHGVWFDKDKTAALLLVELDLSSFNIDEQQLAIEKIQYEFNNLSNNKKLHLDVTGAANMAVKTRAAIQSTSKWLSSIALILMSLLFWWAYRSLRLFFIATLPLVSAIIAALTITNIIFQQVHGIIIAFGITLLGVCLDYPVHLFSHHTKSQSPQQTILSIWPTLRLGVITTALAYLAMLGTGFSGLSQLSIFAISGLIVSLLVTRWIVPCWLQFDFTKAKHPYLTYLSQLTFTLNKKIFIGSTILFFCLFIIVNNYSTIWSTNITDLSPIPEKLKKLDKELRHSIGAPDVNHVFLLKDKDSERLLQRTEELKDKLQPLKNNILVSNIYSAVDFIPSQKKQIFYQQQLPEITNLKSHLQNALSNLPFKKEFFKPFIDDIEKSKTLKPIKVKQILDTPLGQHIQQDLFFKNNEWISIIRLTGVKNETALIQWLLFHPEIQTHYLNLRQATSSLMSDYQQTALYRLLLGSFIIGLILLSVRSKLRATIILLPIILAVLVSVSIQIMLGTQLTLFHILALLLIVGIGLDYSLFFDRSWTSTNDYKHRLHGIFVSASSTLITFGILGFSAVPVLSALGQTVTFGVLGCFVLTLVFSINNSEKP
jgi:predicted exporter